MRAYAVALLALAVACGEREQSSRPSFEFALPDMHAVLSGPAVVSVSGEVERAEFLLDGEVRFEDGTPPFEWTLIPDEHQPGVHSVAVTAFTGPYARSSFVRVHFVPTAEHPVLCTVRPRNGSGGADIVLTGVNFSPDATVTFGGLPASAVEVVSESKITCRAPEQSEPGLLDVVVATASGTATAARAFRDRASVECVFPLSVHPGGRYLVRADGRPFFIQGDTPWALAAQLTREQIVDYLDDREHKGFNTILFNAVEPYFSSQTPPCRNANGDLPFGTLSPVDFTDPIEAYWAHVDFIVGEAKARGIACIVNPAYLGYQGGKEGWFKKIDRTSSADLEAYGEFLAKRYTQGNVIWCMGGDYVPPDVDKQWSVIRGTRRVRTTDLVTAHSGPGDEAWRAWRGRAGFTLNNIYERAREPKSWWYERAAAAYGRAGPMPFFMIEGRYDGEGIRPARARLQAYTPILSGACGHLFGNNPIWGFGEPNFNGGKGAAHALATALSTEATLQMMHVRELFDAHSWWELAPSTGTALVASDLGSGAERICPALAGDGSFAMIWKPSAGPVTLDLRALAPAKVRARFFDTIHGTYATEKGSPFRNTGTRDFDWPGERVLVLDGEPE